MNSGKCKTFIFKHIWNTAAMIIFIVAVWFPVQQSLGQTVKYYGDTSCLLSSKPMQLFSGDKVSIACDTAYLINAIRYRLYEKARTYLMTLNGNQESRTIQELETMLTQLDHYFRGMKDTYYTLSGEVQQKGEENLATLLSVQQDLADAQTALEKSKNDLDDVVRKLKKSNRRELKNKLLIGAAGLGAGLLLGVLLLN